MLITLAMHDIIFELFYTTNTYIFIYMYINIYIYMNREIDRNEVREREEEIYKEPPFLPNTIINADRLLAFIGCISFDSPNAFFDINMFKRLSNMNPLSLI